MQENMWLQHCGVITANYTEISEKFFYTSLSNLYQSFVRFAHLEGLLKQRVPCILYR